MCACLEHVLLSQSCSPEGQSNTVYSFIHAFKNLCDFKQLVYIFFNAVVNLCDLQLHVHMIHEHVIQ